ncbi:glycosyltransferase [Falsiroseomonas sp.]|uniref:glycosyltransferase n=1 Tax=Falsiroseomonas sp. TaxID=2870721 RepID=UPI00356277AF
MKVALVSDSMSAYGGAERVVEQILAIYPHARLFAVLDLVPPAQRRFLRDREVACSFLQNLPLVSRYYRRLLPLWSLAVEQFDVAEYDLVISSHHSAANGVLTRPGQVHVSYVHSPMRYAWDLQNQYLSEARLNRGPVGFLARRMLHKARIWDYTAAQRPDAIATNSHFVAERIRKVHRRDARVIYPPVSPECFGHCTTKGDFYLSLGRLVPYKRVDLLVRAFSRMPHRRLKVIGDGPEMQKVRRSAGPNVEILGYRPEAEVRRTLAEARAFVFPGVEDFGIAALEAQAAGTPVIAFRGGGLTETVQGPDSPQPTGLFFEEQTEAAIVDAVEAFERSATRFCPEACVANAADFSQAHFRDAFTSFVDEAMAARAEAAGRRSERAPPPALPPAPRQPKPATVLGEVA